MKDKYKDDESDTNDDNKEDSDDNEDDNDNLENKKIIWVKCIMCTLLYRASQYHC